MDRLRAATEEQIEHGMVFWYDSVIETGELKWQNELNDSNLRFYRSSSGMLINYTWNELSLQRTRDICESERKPTAKQKVFFGLDVFGRGQTAKFHSKSTLARIAQVRFSAGIFAPAWTYETLRQFGYDITQAEGTDNVNEAFLMRNEKFWWLLWDHLATHPYNKMPFYTDFCLGSGKRNYVKGLPEGEKFFNLNKQSLQPSVPLHNAAVRCYDDAFNGGSCLRILQSDISFRLISADFQAPRGGIVFAYAYKLQPRDGELDCILRFCLGNNARDCYLFLGDYYDTVSLQKGRCYVSPFKPKYNEMLSGGMESLQIPKDMAFPDFAANGWRVRYYVVAFDGPVQIKDVGVLYRKSKEAQDTAYLGAIYANEFDVNSQDFPMDSNIALIQVYGGDLLN